MQRISLCGLPCLLATWNERWIWICTWRLACSIVLPMSSKPDPLPNDCSKVLLALSIA